MVALLEREARRKGIRALFALLILFFIGKVMGILPPHIAQASEPAASGQVGSAYRDNALERLNAGPDLSKYQWRTLGDSGSSYYQGSYYSQPYYQSYYQSYYESSYYAQGYYQGSYQNEGDRIYSFEYEPSGYCVRVTVTKSQTHPRTRIHSDGYNVPCADVGTSARALQRSVELTY